MNKAERRALKRAKKTEALAKAPHDQLIRTANPQNQPPNKDDGISILMNLPAQVTPAHVSKPHAQYTAKTPKWKIIVESLAIFLAAITALVYFLQLRTMQQTMKIDERAWLKMSIEKPVLTENSPVLVYLRIENIGKTPAIALNGTPWPSLFQAIEVPARKQINKASTVPLVYCIRELGHTLL